MRRLDQPTSWTRLLPVLPFLLTCLLPVGLMPAADAARTLALVICTPDGPREQSVPVSGDEQQQAGERCLFSLHAAALLLPATVRVAEPMAFEVPLPPTTAPSFQIAAIHHLPRPRGPPVIL